jgi:Putative amidase domain
MREQGIQYTGITISLNDLNLIPGPDLTITCYVTEFVQLESSSQKGDSVITSQRKPHRFVLKRDDTGQWIVLVHEFINMYRPAFPDDIQVFLESPEISSPYFLDRSTFPTISPLDIIPQVPTKEDEAGDKEWSSTTSIFNGSACASYASTYALNYNSSYRSWSGADCTNFASQSLYAGGWVHKTGWYLSRSYWWYNSVNQTRTWINADYIFDFTSNSSRGYTVASTSDLQLGDMVSADWDKDGIIDHSMIVTYKSGSYIYLSYHSNDTLNKYFGDLPSDANYYGWRITGTN